MMNKRILISFMFLALACLPVFALPEPTSVKAVLNTSNDNSAYDIGFSSAPVSQWSDTPTRLRTDDIVLVPSYVETTEDLYKKNGNAETKVEILYGESDKNGQPTLYAYWRVLSFNAVKLQLSIGGPMKNASNKKLNWCVRWNYKNANGVDEPKELNSKGNKNNLLLPFPANAEGAVLGPLDLAQCPKNFVMKGIGGSTAIHIITDNLMGKDISGEYKGIMTLDIIVTE